MDPGRFAVRKTKYEGNFMVNICDEELLGNRLKEGELEVNITRDYFGEEVVDDAAAGELLKACSIANLVGERIIGKAIGMKLASRLSVRVISDVPFLMIFKFSHG
jgi:hypothetical protein